MRRVLSTQVIAIVSGVFAAIIRKIVPAVVTLPAGNIRADYYAIALTQWDSFEVGVGFFPANRGNRADVLVSLNDGEFKRAIAVLRGVALKRVLVGSADSGHFHLDRHAPGAGSGNGYSRISYCPGFTSVAASTPVAAILIVWILRQFCFSPERIGLSFLKEPA
jgi:hypothetical protein